jgi:hypothetical protein
MKLALVSGHLVLLSLSLPCINTQERIVGVLTSPLSCFYLYIRRVIVTIKSATSITSKSYFWAREEFQSKCATKWLEVYWSSCFCLCVHFVLAAGNVVLVAGNAVLAAGGLAAVPW